MGKTKKIPTPELMWEHFSKYREETKNNPIYAVEQKRGSTILPKDLSSLDKEDIKRSINPIVKMPMQRPLTMEGFENWCADNNICLSLDQYFSNQNNLYGDYVGVCTRIRRVIRQDQIEGGMCGIYNTSITQRLNSLVERQETKIDASVNIPEVPDIGSRK